MKTNFHQEGKISDERQRRKSLSKQDVSSEAQFWWLQPTGYNSASRRRSKDFLLTPFPTRMVTDASERLPTLGLCLLLLGCSMVGADNWELTCPRSCKCKYYNNKRVAKCIDAGFSTVPSTLSDSLHVLDLSDNIIESLGKNAFRKVELINLHKLFLANNRISDVDKDAFTGLTLVINLNLSNNEIGKLHPHTFAGMEKMRILVLDGNFLSRLEGYQFPELPNLQRLLINNCRLSYVNSHAFDNLKSIITVSMKGNLMKVLQPELFISRPKLKSVVLRDNLWVCDCHLKNLVYWIQRKKIGEAQIACHSPERMDGKLWLDLVERDMACPPEIIIPQSEVPINLGGNATLACGARGEPLPQMKWILDGRFLTNLTELTIPFSDSNPNVKFIINEDLEDDGLLWTNLTVMQMGEDFMLHGYDQNSPFKCMVENPAKIVERNVTLVIGVVLESPIITGSYLDVYIVVAIVAVALLLLVLLILICVCCFRRRKLEEERPVAKTNGAEKAFMERNNILIVNPVEKPPRKNEIYEKIPQADIELTELTKGSHKSFEEMNYPEERVGRVRSPLTPLEEEEFDQAAQKLLNDSLNTSSTIDYALQYPDLLDTVKFPRAVSPTQLSYHSLVNPMYSPNPEWRYSYVYPSEFTPSRYAQTMQPQLYQRPGYVTLPRRPRTTSVPSAPPMIARLQLSPTAKLEPIYDTLGPRTTADGTSRTDLTRPMSRSMVEPYNPPTPLSPASPPSLPLHYVPVSIENDRLPTLNLASTLPRSTPNLLEDKVHTLYCFSEEDGKTRRTPTPTKESNDNCDDNCRGSNFNNMNNNNEPLNKEKYLEGYFPNGDSSPSTSVLLRIKPTPKNDNPNRSNVNGNSGNASTRLRSHEEHPLPNGLIRNADNSDHVAVAAPSVKKIPPKPLPKPSVKRLSVSSTASDATSKLSTGGSVAGLNYQDEGPDGTEV